MGTWGVHPFESDLALDFWCTVERALGISSKERVSEIVRVVNSVHKAKLLDDYETSELLIAVVLTIAFTDRAWIAGYQGMNDSYKKDITAIVDADQAEWDATMAGQDGFLRKASECIDKCVGGGSESAELWEGNPEWLASCNELKTKLEELEK